MAQEGLCQPVLHNVRAAPCWTRRHPLASHPEHPGRGLRRRLLAALAWAPRPERVRGVGVPPGRGAREERRRVPPAWGLGQLGAAHGTGRARAQQPGGGPGGLAHRGLHGEPRVGAALRRRHRRRRLRADEADRRRRHGRGLRRRRHVHAAAVAGRRPRRSCVGRRRLPEHRGVPHDAAGGWRRGDRVCAARQRFCLRGPLRPSLTGDKALHGCRAQQLLGEDDSLERSSRLQ
mmetsp:Transcript_97764/g.291996  ORF Transcript_97764/g.291996 Transcript_97764/m.291996 type:complete len:233 (-) Transcript_97764:107-805(-)